MTSILMVGLHSKDINSFIRLLSIQIVLLLSFSIKTMAEQPDSLMTPPASDPLPSFMVPVDRDSVAGKITPSESSINIDPAIPFTPQYYTGSTSNLNPRINSISPGNIYSPLFSNNSISLNATGSQISMPGFMGIEKGSLTAMFNHGPLTLTAWAGAEKFGYFRGVQSAWNFGGQINLRLSDKWSLTAWGEYVTPLHPLTPAMAGIMSSSNFGGYASYNISDRWGISIGAQATRSLVTNKWEAQPIVTPYYRINKRVSIGVNVGGILYNIAKDYIDRKSYNNHPMPGTGNPSRPPIPTPAKVAPRR